MARAQRRTKASVWVAGAAAAVAICAAMLHIMQHGGAPAPVRASASVDASLGLVRQFQHDRGAFTQGLLVYKGRLFESTGLYGRSTVRELDPRTGRIIRSTPLEERLFGEGLAVHGRELYLLTWRERVVRVFDLDLRSEASQDLAIDGDGWGLTSNGDVMFWTDGSDKLSTVLPPSEGSRNMEVKNKVSVTYRDPETRRRYSISRLNELEFIDGYVYANIWGSENIVAIDPKTGRVCQWLLLGGVVPRSLRDNPDAVLNGIAYNATADTILVTGKLWPVMYELERPFLTGCPADGDGFGAPPIRLVYRAYDFNA